MADTEGKKGVMAAILRGPVGQVGRPLCFILLCFTLFIIGIVKGIIIGPLAALIFFVGNTSIVIGLWPVHVVVLYRTIATTKQLGTSLKVLGLLLLHVPLLLWPVFAAVGSIIAGLGYGIGQPLVATFEAVGDSRDAKFYHTFVDGTMSTLTGSCTVVRDFLDFTYHSIFEILDEFRLREPKGGKPCDIKLRQLPACLLVGILGVIVETPVISLVALCKSPVMLYKGWSKLLRDLVGRHGSCLEAACVPFAGLALVLWPLVVAVTVLFAIFCSPILGLFGATVVYQEMSLKSGLLYLVAIVAEFDEYSNDVLHSREGSCLPRPRYRKSVEKSTDGVGATKSDIETPQNAPRRKNAAEIPQLNTQKSLRQIVQELNLVQIWDNMFRTLETQGKILVAAGALKTSDLEAFVKGNKSKSKIVAVGFPAFSHLQTLLLSAKSNSPGLLLLDGTEVTEVNKPRDRLSDWFFDPLVTLKEQLRAAHLQEEEERFLDKLVLMCGDLDRMEKWDNGGVEPEDEVRKGELEALARRLQGIATSITRVPTHRRRFECLTKCLLAYSQEILKSSSARKDSSDRSRSSSLRKDLSDKSRSSSLRRENLNSSTRREGSNRFDAAREITTPIFTGDEVVLDI